MRFINLLGDTRMLINVENITFVEETKDGCKFHFAGGNEHIISGCKYDDVLKDLGGGGDE